jgi:hypothetical protein
MNKCCWGRVQGGKAFRPDKPDEKVFYPGGMKNSIITVF